MTRIGYSKTYGFLVEKGQNPEGSGQGKEGLPGMLLQVLLLKW